MKQLKLFSVLNGFSLIWIQPFFLNTYLDTGKLYAFHGSGSATLLVTIQYQWCLVSWWTSAAWCLIGPQHPDVLLLLFCLTSCWSSVAWCPARFCCLMSCRSTAALCPAASLLTGVLRIHCCMISCCFSADWSPADLLLHDVLLLLC